MYFLMLQISDNICISTLLLVGTASSFLLSAYWAKTTTIGGVEHSTCLFILVFFLSLVDCTSSVLFLPFMAIFRDIYLNSYLIGEGLSGFIPSVIAIAQGKRNYILNSKYEYKWYTFKCSMLIRVCTCHFLGSGGNPYCQNVSVNGTWEMQTVTPEPRFSAEVFFDFLAGMMAVRFVSKR